MVWFMVFNATFNNTFFLYFSYILEVSFICGGKRSAQRKPLTCRKLLTNFITQCCIEYTLSWTGFELTTLVVIGIDCTGSCKSNYHTITTAPYLKWQVINIIHHLYWTIIYKPCQILAWPSQKAATVFLAPSQKSRL